MAWVRAGSPASSARITRTGCPARPPLALTYDAQARMAGGTVPVTAPRIPDAAPNDPSRISDFAPAGVPGKGVPAAEPDGPPVPPAAAAGPAPVLAPAAVLAGAPDAAAPDVAACPGEPAADGAPPVLKAPPALPVLTPACQAASGAPAAVDP